MLEANLTGSKHLGSHLGECSFRAFSKASGQNWGKMIDLTSKLEEINDVKHNKGSKIYPQNQVILDCIMSSIPHKHKT